MLRTQLCDLLQIEFPVIQAGMGPFTGAQLVAAVSSAGGLGSLGASQRPGADLERQLALIRRLTDRPFAVNHLVPTLNQEAFALTLTAKPSIISLALGEPGDLVKRAHDVGILVMQQVHTVKQARQAAEREVDVIIAQGSEAGGFGGTSEGWKQAILAAESEDAVKVEVWNDMFPLPGGGGYGTVPRALRTPFIEEWQQRRDDARREAERLQGEVNAALQQGRLHETVPFSGQTTGLIRDILPAGDIVRSIVAQAEEALKRASQLLR